MAVQVDARLNAAALASLCLRSRPSRWAPASTRGRSPRCARRRCRGRCRDRPGGRAHRRGPRSPRGACRRGRRADLAPVLLHIQAPDLGATSTPRHRRRAPPRRASSSTPRHRRQAPRGERRRVEARVHLEGHDIDGTHREVSAAASRHVELVIAFQGRDDGGGPQIVYSGDVHRDGQPAKRRRHGAQGAVEPAPIASGLRLSPDAPTSGGQVDHSPRTRRAGRAE